MSVGNKKDTWKTIINVVISILTAIATTLGLTSCM
ncbi:smalltalk protein [Prevotella sp. AGR2160]|nr:smalltalk protein [Prevotella sp. AGR2160]